jgi:hypothetical protein
VDLVDLDQKEKVSILVKVSSQMGLSADEILALYLVVGDGIFFILDLFQGRSVKFPSLRVFRHAVNTVGGYRLQKLKKPRYWVNGKEAGREEIRLRDEVRVDGVNLTALSSPQEILGETYILCEFKESGNE